MDREARAGRTLLQLQLARIPFKDAFQAVAAEIPLDPPALERLRREGMDLDLLRDQVDWTPGVVPPPGTLARDLYATFSELAIAWGEGAPMGPALERAARLPVRPGLRDALRDMATAGALSDVLRAHPELFAPSVVALLHRTETAGNLHEAFLLLADGVMSGCFLPRE